MHQFTVTLKNYRCFEDAQPLSVEVRPGFTALVGPNNSGKSSFLKFFYELRRLIEALRVINTLSATAKGNELEANYLGVEDPLEIFYNRNSRPLTIDIDFPVTLPDQVSRVRMIMDRTRPANWRAELFLGTQREKLGGYTGSVHATTGKYVFVVEGTTSSVGNTNVNLTPLFEMCDMLSNSLYVGAFRNAISEGAGTYYDLPIGTSFIATWDSWKTGPTRSANEAAQAVADDLAHIFGHRRLEINAANGQRTLQIIVDGKPYRLRELGAGFAQFLVVLGYIAIRKPSYLLIDEPELNLHPSLQIDFLTSLASYSTHGVMFATHSIGLARATADQIYSFQKNGDSSCAKPYEQTPNLAEFVGEMSFSSFKEMGHETILLVEGVNEVKAIQQFLRVLRKDHTVVVMPLGGSQLIRGGVQAELAELGRLSNNVAVLIDSERDQEGTPLASDRNAFVEDCQALGFTVHVTELRAFENYLSESAIHQTKGTSYRALRPYEQLRDMAPSWGKGENWRIARAMTESEILASDIGQFLANLK